MVRQKNYLWCRLILKPFIQKGRTCHAAIIARELGLPTIVGCDRATDILKDEQEVTVSCAEGEEGHIYNGLLLFEVEELELGALPSDSSALSF